MAMMIRPMHRGSMPFGAPIFFLSVMARMHRISAPVAITCKTKASGNQHNICYIHKTRPAKSDRLLMLFVGVVVVFERMFSSYLICCRDLCPMFCLSVLWGLPLSPGFRLNVAALKCNHIWLYIKETVCLTP